eukprot:COSAG05_NODE_504_length_9208_cov_22.420024_12_plen_59_part_00
MQTQLAAAEDRAAHYEGQHSELLEQLASEKERHAQTLQVHFCNHAFCVHVRFRIRIRM